MVWVASELNNAGYCVCYSIELYFVVYRQHFWDFLFLWFKKCIYHSANAYCGGCIVMMMMIIITADIMK